MAFGKVCQLIVKERTNATGIIEEIDIASGLDFGFSVTRSIAFNGNTAEFNIANVDPKDRLRFFRKGNTITFNAGWEDQGGDPVPCFVGTITTISESWDEDQNSVLNVSADATRSVPRNATGTREDGYALLLDGTYVALGYAPGTSILSALQDITTKMGFVLIGSEPIAGIKMPSGFNFVGRVRGALNTIDKMLMASGYYIMHERTDIHVLAMNKEGVYTGASLSPTSGLLSCGLSEDYIQKVPYKKVKGGKYELDVDKIEQGVPKSFVEFTCIFHPLITPNALVFLDYEPLFGKNGQDVLVESYTFSGDNGEGKFDMAVRSSYHGKDPNAGITLVDKKVSALE